jgi:hypothetical protein
VGVAVGAAVAKHDVSLKVSDMKPSKQSQVWQVLPSSTEPFSCKQSLSTQLVLAKLHLSELPEPVDSASDLAVVWQLRDVSDIAVGAATRQMRRAELRIF